jgi:hypothetical protein
VLVLVNSPPGWQPGAVRRIFLLPILAIAFVAGACGGPAAGGLAGKSASEVLALAQAAAQKEGSFHFVDQTGTGKNEQRLVGDSASESGEQVVSGPNGRLNVRLVDSVIYVTGSEAVMGAALKLTNAQAAKYAGKWISLQKTDAPYETVAKALAPSAELTPYTPVGNLRVGNVSTLRGRSVLAVSGGASEQAGATATATLYVSTSAPFVPVGGSLVGTGAQKGDSEVVAFTAWGERVHPQAPTSATPYSSLASG